MATEAPGGNVAEGETEERQSRLAGETDVPVSAEVSKHLTLDDRVGLLRAMLSMRGIEERAMMLYRQGKVPGSFYDGFGQEAVSAGPAWAMHGHDRLCVLHRDLAAHLIRGVSPTRIMAQYMGREGGITGGRDGNDVEAMFEATRQARERAIAGDGPTLIEAVTMRMHGHAAHDDMKYVPAEQIEEWRRKDPIDRQVRRMEALGVDVAALRAEVKAEIEAAVAEALAMPMPDGETATERLFADAPALLEDAESRWSGF